MSRSKTGNAPKGVRKLHAIIHDLEPILDREDTFTLAETPIGGADADQHQVKGPIRRCVQNGALQKCGRTHYEGNLRTQYRWNDDAREYLNDYLDSLDKLPCGDRVHVPDTRDDPEGKVSCNYCDRLYDRDRFMELIRDDE